MLKGLRKRNEDRGAALIWIAGMLVVLLSMAAFATDLGWILLWNSRLQAAADSAALAGVVNLPGFPAQAQVDAQAASAANGFSIPGEATMTPEVIAENQYRVTLEADVDTFFLGLIGFNNFHLSQTAHAQYIKPVRLGSPDNQFGGPGEFWAAINGQYTEIRQGDPYASRCITHSDTPEECVGAENTQYRDGGYYYGIEIGPNSNGLFVDFFDGGHYIDVPGSPTGDSSWRWGWPEGQRGVYLEYALYEPDATPTDPTDNDVLRCDGIFPVDNDISDGHLNSWGGPNNCSVGGSLTEGIWVLQLPSPLYEGATKFGIMADVGSGPPPRVFGILDMSIYVNFSGGSAEPYLAEIRPEHAGKTLEIDIWDLGDNDGTAGIQVLTPLGGVPCSWTSSNSEPDGSSPTCSIDISNQKYNAAWLNVTVPIPDDPCLPDISDPLRCWWKIHIDSTGQAHDRTTWTARVSGDPVRLVD
ncbi:MAG TPA: pilus assembly protein TadG-related protein [Acidimicrobiia bacterium]